MAITEHAAILKQGVIQKTLMLLVVLATALIGCSIIPRSGPPPFDTSQAECEPREDDPDGYLLSICEYIVENFDTFAINPAELGIVSVEIREVQGEEVIFVRLDCCYAGDVAIIDPTTGDVLQYQLGPL